MRELLMRVLDLMEQVYVQDNLYQNKEALEIRRLKHQIRVVLDAGYYNATLVDVDLRHLLGGR